MAFSSGNEREFSLSDTAWGHLEVIGSVTVLDSIDPTLSDLSIHIYIYIYLSNNSKT